jgi:hypothetical protein
MTTMPFFRNAWNGFRQMPAKQSLYIGISSARDQAANIPREISFLMLAFKPFILHSLGSQSQSYLVWMLTSDSFI